MRLFNSKSSPKIPLMVAGLVILVGCKDGSKSGTAEIISSDTDRFVSSPGEWLGPLGSFRNGHSAENDWNQDWAIKEPQLLWKQELGLGAAGVSCFKGMVYCVGNKENKEIVQCLNSNTGQVIWQYSYPCPIDKRMFEGGSASTPVVDKSRNALYVLSHEGELRALSINDGKEMWKVSYITELKGSRPNYGYSSSPLVHRDVLITVPGGKDGAVVALDPETGEKKWSSGKDGPGYSSPIQINDTGSSNVMVFNSYGLSVFDTNLGQELARARWKTDYKINASLPLYIGGHIFVCSGYGKGGGMFRFDANELNLIYETKEAVCQFQSPIESGGFAYMVIGDNSTRAKLACMRLDTGGILWTEPLAGNRGNVIVADNKLIVVSERGEVVLCDASDEGFNGRGRFQAVGGRCWAPPAFADSKLYIRNNKGRLVCYDVRK